MAAVSPFRLPLHCFAERMVNGWTPETKAICARLLCAMAFRAALSLVREAFHWGPRPGYAARISPQRDIPRRPKSLPRFPGLAFPESTNRLCSKLARTTLTMVASAATLARTLSIASSCKSLAKP